MPEAIATTKRKFHRLLDTLTSYANTPAQAAAPTTPLTAREKLEQASERVRKRQRQDGSLSSIESRLTQAGSTVSLVHKRSPKKSQLDKSKAAPNFSPWSHETFLQRLQTFSRVSLWHPKPEGIDEVAWAKRGWQCVDVNTVACLGGCGRRVVVSMAVPDKKSSTAGDEAADEEDDDDEQASLEQALTVRYKQEIVEGHSESCLWRKAGCKDDVYRLQVVRPAAWQPALKKRYGSLLAISTSIEAVTLQTTQDLTLPQLSLERIHAELLSDILPTSDVTEEPPLRALEIAMHGWRGTSELSADLLHCDACFQRIGLWMYQPGYQARTSTEEDEEPATLDLLELHREYCPWRNAQSQQASGSLAGLNAAEILSKVVATYIKERRRKTEEQIVPTETTEPADPFVDLPKLSKEEVERQDRERESRLQKLKRMLTIKRSSKTLAKAK